MVNTSRSYDYFIVSYERHNDKLVIRDAMQDYFYGKEDIYTKGKDNAQFSGPWEYPDNNNHAKPIGGTRRENLKSLSRHAFWWKLSAAFVGVGVSMMSLINISAYNQYYQTKSRISKYFYFPLSWHK